MPGCDFAHAQNDMNTHILRKLEALFLLDLAYLLNPCPAEPGYILPLQTV